MINPEELQELREDLRENSEWDVSVLLQALIYAELKKLNTNLSNIDTAISQHMVYGGGR